MRIGRLLAGVTLVATTVALTACDSSARTSAPAAVTSTLPAAAASTPAASTSAASAGDLLRGRVLPMFAYEDTPQSSFETSRAIAILKNDCLARYGFPPFPVPTAPTASPPMYRVFGITDPAVAARYGFHLDPVGLAENAPPAPTYSPELKLVLLGVAPGQAVPDPNDPMPEPTQTYEGKPVPRFGCQGEATAALDPVGVTGDELGLAQQLGSESWVRSTTDPRMIAVTARFAQCMHAKGYPGSFTSPLGAVEGFDIDRPLSSEEISLAVADVDCKRRTKLIDTWFAVDSEYENAAIQKNIETLTKVKAAKDSALAKAVSIAGTGG